MKSARTYREQYEPSHDSGGSSRLGAVAADDTYTMNDNNAYGRDDIGISVTHTD